MQKSEQINEIAFALAQFQGEIEDAPRDAQGFGYKYATLGAVLSLVRPLLSKYEMAIVQSPKRDGNRIAVETTILHKSGQWISETLSFDMPEPILNSQGKKKNTDAQDCGSIISYIRRYSITAMLGITQIDDDAAAPEQPEYKPKKQASKPAQQQQYANPVPAQPKPVQQVQRIKKETQDLILSHTSVIADFEQKLGDFVDRSGVKTLPELTEPQAQAFLKKYKKEYEENCMALEEETRNQYDRE